MEWRKQMILKSTKKRNKYKCPKCGDEYFSVTAHVAQLWKVDEDGTYMEAINACTDVLHRPDATDMWECLACNYEDVGTKFLVAQEGETA
jgi:ribosomal protein L37AE/L43A